MLLYLILAGIISLFYLWTKYRQSYWARRGVYSPPGNNWFFGHFRRPLLLQQSAQDRLAELHVDNPDKAFLGFYALQKPCLLIRSPELVKQMLIKDSDVFLNRHFASGRTGDKLAVRNIFASKDSQWRQLRYKLSPAFSTGKIKKLFNRMMESASNARAYIERKVEDGEQTFEVRRLVTKYTTDVASEMSFGVRTDSFVEPEPEFYLRTREFFKGDIINSYHLLNNFFFPRVNDILGLQIIGKHYSFLRKIMVDSVKQRRKIDSNSGDVVDTLKNLEGTNDIGYTFETDDQLAQAAGLLGAGLETSALTMSFTLLQISRHPDVQRKLRRELAEKLAGKKSDELTYELVVEMEYLQQVISETLRMFPAAPIVDRTASRDYKIPGTDVVIEKGTAVYICLNGLHYDPDYHPEPTVFDPERFNETRKNDIKSGSYIPFGTGPRICIGMRVAMLQIMVGLITILSEYEISWNKNKFKNAVSKRSVFNAPANDFYLDFKRSPLMNVDQN